ncbi:autotransporter domain-containing protein [Paraburkholderia bonniea]|uniref:autotransporter domain-containing protein n=1 Tax=Paraburkholderia bonniea TaxID=2152891 RepID=UPI0025748A04|nr:autotransporter domain-containing protein [Paraburkholderia bonniea]WJF92060.1 autotransporter domain-containing protein [Paraburkholderia bonniea]WJF95380.1 autotransporter domain-containing protein [Paraburkholderia bonniea]
MNHIYSVVWNSTLRLLQVASEQVRSRSGTSGAKRVRGAQVAAAALLVPQPAQTPASALKGTLVPGASFALTQRCSVFACRSGVVVSTLLLGLAAPLQSAQADSPGGGDPMSEGVAPGGAGNGHGGTGGMPRTMPGTVGVGGVGGEGGDGGVELIPSDGGKGGAVGMDTGGSPAGSVTGEAGGWGGAALGASGSGGGGGGGGAGAWSSVVNDSVTNAVGFTIQGGAGGMGGSGALFAPAGGGGGGGSGITLDSGTLDNSGTIKGGAGGAGGSNTTIAGSGGGGGDGVNVIGGEVTLTNTGTITGGAGGINGMAFNSDDNGSGGSGGNGVTMSDGVLANQSGGSISGGAGASVTSGFGVGGNGGAGVEISGNSENVNLWNAAGATITGGAAGQGGNPGIDPVDPSIGANGSAGVGITGANLRVLNAGTISGGREVDGSYAAAVVFTGGTNVFELDPGGVVLGKVDATAGISSTLVLGGEGTASFNAGAIGTDYVGFQSYQKNGSGTWTLTGSNAGLTPWRLKQGTLSIAEEGSLGDVSQALRFNGGTLNTSASFEMQRSFNLSDLGGTIDTNANTTLTVLNTIEGEGRLTKTGDGTLVLDGDNSYRNGTVLKGGTVLVSQDKNLGESGARLFFDGGTLATSSSFITDRSINLALGGGSFSVPDTQNLTLTNTISGIGGIRKLGAGTLTLEGLNDYTGSSEFHEGTVAISADANLGDAAGSLVFSGGTLEATQGMTLNRATILQGGVPGVSAGGGTLQADSGTLVFAGQIAGPGGLTKTGAGTLQITGANLYTGGTTVGAGTLEVNSSGHGLGTGNVTVAAAGGAPDATLRFIGNSRADDLSISTGANGTLAFAGASNAAGAKVLNNLGGTVDLGALSSASMAIGSLSGAGQVKLGHASVTLGGLNRDDTISGAITDDASNGAGGGSAALYKSGTGNLTLNGMNSYSGGTSVNQGQLTIGDAFNSGATTAGDVQVATPGLLRGFGTIGGSVLNQGTVWPGGSTMGQLSLQGNYTQSASGTLQIDVNPNQASLLKVGGAVSLNGTLSLLYAPGTYRAATYQIVSSNGLSGSFSTVSTNANQPNNLIQSVLTSQTGVVLSLSNPVGPVDPSNPSTPVDPGTPGTPGNPGGPVVLAPTNATLFGALGSAAMREGQRVNDVLLERLSRLAGACPSGASSDAVNCQPRGRYAWVQATGDVARVGGNHGAPGYTDRRYGFLAGVERQFNAWTAGVAGGYSHADVTEDQTGSSGTIDTLRIAGYGGRALGPVNLAGTFGYAHDFLASSRNFGSFGNADGNSQGDELHLGAQVSLPLNLGRFVVTPRAGVRYQYFHGSAFDESGPTNQNLAVEGQNLQSLQPYFGVTAAYPFLAMGQRPGLVEVRLGYAYETLDPSRAVAVTAADGTGFVVPGTTASRGMLSAGVGVKLPLRKALDLSASYDTLLHTGNVSGQALRVSLSYRF